VNNKKTDLSVIILSYNTKLLLKNCLLSVLKSKLDDYRVQVIVVDNASTDGSAEMVKKNFDKKVELVLSKRNLGFSGGNNLGLKSAKGKYILFLNSDTEIRSSALKKMIAFMDKSPKVGACTAKTMLFSGGMDPDCHRGFPTPWASFTYFLGLEKLFPKSKIFGQYHKLYLDLNKIHEIDAGFGTFLFTRKKIIDSIGGWSEEYFFYGEDLDIFYRIKEAGWKIIFYPESLVMHYKGASSGLRKESRKMGVVKANRKIRIKTAKASVKAMEIFYQKFYQDKYPRWLTYLIISGIRIKGFFRVLAHSIK